VRRGIEGLGKCENMISTLGLFSANETKEDISTSNLKYILVSNLPFSAFYFILFYFIFPSSSANQDYISNC